MKDGQTPGTTHNELSGESGAAVQAGTVHGGIHVGPVARGTLPGPRQLPMDVTGFVNREEHMARLDGLLPGRPREDDRMTGAPAVISAIAGTPGIGKTALAVHWAHRVRHHYTDGDLYIDMRGYGPGPAVSAGQALDSFLRALNVAPDRIPADFEERAATYRSVLNGKRVLVVIDNASHVDQVRNLLPGSPTCTTLVTSRNTLRGLFVREGAVRMVIDTLSKAESLELLRNIVGTERVDAERDEAEKLAGHCAYLPLALRIIAERITSDPYTDLAEFVAELADEHARLDALEIEDDELSDVRAVFSWSYKALNPDLARLFRLLGLHPGSEFGVGAVAALIGADQKTARRLIGTLVSSNLVQPVAPERYSLHDLLRVYAMERVNEEETSPARVAAVRRCLLWYLVSVYNGHKVILPGFHDVPIDTGEAPITPVSFEAVDTAMQWFEREKGNLLGALTTAVRTEQFDLAWRFPAVMYGFFELRSYWSEWREIHTVGVEAARSIGDRYGEACNYLGLGDANWLLRRLDEALVCYQNSAEAGREVGDGWVEGFSLRQTGILLQEDQQTDRAIEVTREAIGVFQAIGEKRGEGMAWLSLGKCYGSLGMHAEAADHCRTALGLFAEVGDEWSLAWGRCALGLALKEAGSYEESRDSYRLALTTFGAFEDRLNESRALIGVAEAYEGLGQREEARTHLRRATALLGALDDSNTADLWARVSPLSEAGL